MEVILITLKMKIFEMLGVIRVYSKAPGKDVDKTAKILNEIIYLDELLALTDFKLERISDSFLISPSTQYVRASSCSIRVFRLAPWYV